MIKKENKDCKGEGIVAIVGKGDILFLPRVDDRNIISEILKCFCF